ncbi:hypothetical protein LOK49_LG12G00432 [Camellia lanceoleosa]|uniref:Uncharacterized protein n=1 Tax=Camellia lanceoleosa TaxID=1840588 RepID=A0ACC0FT90_9ERIC|nr:hypothetical protein LOK49_LG12G00432 [Camellia lanceoleosa]
MGFKYHVGRASMVLAELWAIWNGLQLPWIQGFRQSGEANMCADFLAKEALQLSNGNVVLSDMPPDLLTALTADK